MKITSKKKLIELYTAINIYNGNNKFDQCINQILNEDNNKYHGNNNYENYQRDPDIVVQYRCDITLICMSNNIRMCKYIIDLLNRIKMFPVTDQLNTLRELYKQETKYLLYKFTSESIRDFNNI